MAGSASAFNLGRPKPSSYSNFAYYFFSLLAYFNFLSSAIFLCSASIIFGSWITSTASSFWKLTGFITSTATKGSGYLGYIISCYLGCIISSFGGSTLGGSFNFIEADILSFISVYSLLNRSTSSFSLASIANLIILSSSFSYSF